MGLLDEAIREHLALKRGRGADPAEIAREEKDALGPPTRTQEPQAERAREERGESEDAALDDPATALAPADGGPRAGREPRLRLAAEPPERDEPRPAPEGRGDRATDAPPPAESRLRITEDDLRERTPGGVGPPPPPADYDAPLDPADDEPHTDDFVFGDEDVEEDFFADELDEPPAGERHPDDPLPEPPAAFLSPEPPLAPEPPPPLDQPTQQYALEDVEDATRPSAPSPSPPDVDAEDEPEGEELLEETPEFLEETPDHDRLWFEQKPPRDFDF